MHTPSSKVLPTRLYIDYYLYILKTRDQVAHTSHNTWYTKHGNDQWIISESE